MQNVFVLKSNGKDYLHKSPRSPIILQSVSLTLQLSLPSIRICRHISNPFVRISFHFFHDSSSQRKVIFHGQTHMYSPAFLSAIIIFHLFAKEFAYFQINYYIYGLCSFFSSSDYIIHFQQRRWNGLIKCH